MVEVARSYGKKFLWEVVDDHATEEKNGYDEIGLREFCSNLFTKNRRGFLEKGSVSILICYC